MATPSTIVGKSVDSSVQHTNDDSVLSKRSAAKHGYLDDNYLRYFVKKPARRAPLINRGYYLRIVAMTELVEQCLQLFAKSMPTHLQQRLQVLSLGAGFDTLAPRLYEREEYQNVHFYEVDFPPVIANKTGLVAAAPKGSFPFMSESDTIIPGSTTMNFGRYHSLGLDLRETESKLSTILSDQGFDHSAPTVVYAECVMQYMTPDCSDGMVRWTATHLPNAIFMAYDQINPYDSFGGVMQHSLRSKCSPLAGVHSFPNGIALSKRAVRFGLEQVRFANFYDLALYHISNQEKSRVDKLEMFDEFEEWAEMCEHYGILCARTKDSAVQTLPSHPALVDVLAQQEHDEVHLSKLSAPNATSQASSSAATTVVDLPTISVDAWPNARLGLECYSNGRVHSEHIGGDATNPCIVAFGGVSISKGTTRTDSVFVHSLRDGDLKVINTGNNSNNNSNNDPSSVLSPGARSHHSFTRISPFKYVVFGGRTNPITVFNDAFLCEVAIQEGSSSPTATVRWTNLTIAGNVVPPPRFRHTDVALPDGSGFVVIGGRGADGASRHNDVWAASVDIEKGIISWKQIQLDESSCAFPAHCTAASCLIPTSASTFGILVCGGMLYDNTTVGTAFILKIDRVLEKATVTEPSWAKRVGENVMGRFGHTVTLLPPSAGTSFPRLLIFGGLGFVPKVRTQYWQPLLIVDPLSATSATEFLLSMPHGKEHTSFVRHSVVPLSEGNPDCHRFGIVGGGFTCFSFGIYSPVPVILTLSKKELMSKETELEDQQTEAQTIAGAPSTPSLSAMKDVFSIPYSSEAWDKYHRSPFPVVLRGTPIGSCLEKWVRTEDLKAGGKGVTVAVHVANKAGNKLLDFVHKNFDFRHVSFADLIDHCWPSTSPSSSSSREQTWYFRSVGANMKTESSNFYKDFAGLASDFNLPMEVQQVVLDPTVHHQSCFRINQSGMRLWPHYDVMDNILVNVVGSKQVVLFPPTQYNNLYMNGSSSPVLDVCAPDLSRYPRALEALKFAQVVTLQPGDLLILPALWVHAIAANTACISINLFYKRHSMLKSKQAGANIPASTAPLATSLDDPYDKKDLYGNKDLPSLVAAKKTISDTVRDALKGNDAPEEFKALMLEQLIGELQSTAEELFIQSQQRK